MWVRCDPDVPASPGLKAEALSVEFAPEVIADPIGVVVELIVEREPGLDRSTITRVVEQIAGGRVKRRRLACALLDRPPVLDDGRSPAPRAVGDLLIALNKAGASRISAPVCAGCGKHLRTLQRRDDQWYCGVCGPARQPCGQCGRTRPVATRDRDGQPRCVACPPDSGRDPLELAVEVITSTDPAVPTDVAAAAVRLAAPRSGHRRQLAWALAQRPELLTGTGAEAPTPSVLRLIEALCNAQSKRDSPPTLPPLRSNHPPAQANRWQVAVPQLHRQVPRPTLRPVWGPARSRDPRHPRATAVPPLLGHRSRQPRNMHRVWSTSTGPGSNTGWTAVRQVRPSRRADVRNLRAHRSLRGLQGHRQTLVLGLHAALDPLRWLRAACSPARWNNRRAVVLVVHPCRGRLAQLPCGVPPVFRTADQIGSDLERVREIGWEIHEIQARIS